MEERNNPEVLKQVEALFSAIDQLPVELRSEALEKIHTKLGIQSKNDEPSPRKRGRPRKSKAPRKNQNEIVEPETADKPDENQDTAEESKTEVPTRKRGRPSLASVAHLKPERRKKNNVDTDAEADKSSVLVKKTTRASVNAKLAEKAEAQQPAKKSKRKTKVPQKFLRDTAILESDDSDVESAETPKVPEDDGDVESAETPKVPEDDGNIPWNSVEDASQNQDFNNPEEDTSTQEDGRRKHQDYNPKKDLIPLKIFRVPSGIKPNELSEQLKEDEISTHDARRIKGTRTFYGCTMCDKKFTARSLVHVHMRVHTGHKPHACNLCDRSFTQIGALNQHIKRHEGVKNESCTMCDYKSLNKVDMTRHMARHTGEKNFFCEICARRFVTSPSLKDHIKHVHERANTYICQICGFVTHRPDNLKRHIDIRHSNKEYVQCPVCNLVIKQRSSFITHMRSHTGERPLSCKKCGKTFKNHSQVAAHMRSHKEGTFECEHCKRRFKTRFHLRRHTVVHTGEKPFSCNYCSYSCNVKGNINKHVKMVHGIKDFSFRPDKEPKTVPVEAFEEPEIVQLKEKGEAMAQEFLTKISILKDEHVTVESLQEALEDKKRKIKEQLIGEIESEARQPKKKKKHRAPNRQKVLAENLDEACRRLEEEVREMGQDCNQEYEIIMAEDDSCSNEIDAEVPELHIDVAEEEIEVQEMMDGATAEIIEVVPNLEGNEMLSDGETIADGATILIPSEEGFICVQQSDYEIKDANGISVPLSMLTGGGKVEPGAVYLIQCSSQDEMEEILND